MAAFDVLNSCRFNRADSAHMNLTFPSAGDGTLWTFSTWFKRTANFGSLQEIFTCGVSGTLSEILITAGNKIQYRQTIASSVVEDLTTTAYEAMDPTGWYHLVVAYDSDHTTAADRCIIYINGVRMTLTGSNITVTRASDFNTADACTLGENLATSADYFDGYLAETIFVGGAQSAATVFGTLRSNGSWEANDAAPTYGANGFRLEYQTAAALGDDTSGNVNDFTTVNMATNDQHDDSPAHNHCVINQLDGVAASVAVSNGNREITNTAADMRSRRGTMWLESGKWYWEVEALTLSSANAICGVSSRLHTSLLDFAGETNYSWGLENQSGTALRKWHNNSSTAVADTIAWTTGVYFMCAYDADTGKLWFGLNGTWLDSGNPSAGTGEQYTVDQFPVAPMLGVMNSDDLELRAATSLLEGTVPTGFNALSTANLTEPAIEAPHDYFDIAYYTGDGIAIGSGGQAITSLNFQPDLVWIKSRDNSWEHVVTDSERGVTKHLRTDTNAAEQTTAEALTSFDASGFTVGSENKVNQSTTLYAAWCWKKAALSGFDIATWTGSGGSGTVAHALSAVPNAVIAKRRDATSTPWYTYNENLLDTGGAPVTDPETDYMVLDTTAAVADSAFVWNDTAPDSSVVALGSDLNTNTATYVAYVFKSIEGFSKFSSYVGNGDVDENFHYCGFRPRFLVIKRIDTANSWMLKYAGVDQGPIDVRLNAEDNAVESASSITIDFLSNGWTARSLDAVANVAAAEYVFWAIAELPEKYASIGVAPTVATGAVTAAFSLAGRGGLQGAPAMALSVAATATLPISSVGAVTAQFAAGGTMSNAAIHGGGAVTMALSAAATTVLRADGAVSAAMTVAATAILNDTNGAVSMTLTVASAGTITFPVNGSPLVPVPATNGVIINAPLIQGEIALLDGPLFSLSGIAENSGTLLGTVALPQITLDAHMAGVAEILLPKLQVTATILPGRVITGAAIPVPLVGLTAAMSEARTISGNVPLVNPKINGIIISGALLVTTIQVPVVQVDATILSGRVLYTPVGSPHSIGGTRNTGAKYCS